MSQPVGNKASLKARNLWMTLKVIHRLQVFSNAIRQTFMQYFTRFLRYLSFLYELAYYRQEN